MSVALSAGAKSKSIAETFAALFARDKRELELLRGFFVCLGNRGHSIDVGGQCSNCGSRPSALDKSLGQLIAEELARREGN